MGNISNRLNRSLKQLRRALVLDTRTGYLGDGSGEVHDRRNPGNYYVRFHQADEGYTAPVSLPLAPNANLPSTDGLAVDVGYDRAGRNVILGANIQGMAEGGYNPLQLNPLDDQLSHFVNQTQITTFYATRHADLDNKPFYASVFPGMFYDDTTLRYFAGNEIDLSSFQPASGEHCFAVVFIKSADAALEAFASTAINTSDPLTTADIQEAINSATAGSIPIWAWEMTGNDTALTIDPALQVDIRQFVSAGGGGGGTPSDTVEDETAYGITPDAGAATEYSRADHTHGSVAHDSLDGLTDVAIASAAQGDILTRKASDWNNVNVPVESVVARITGADVAPISMGASTILARLASGSIVAATVAQIKTLLAIVKADISDFGTYRTQLTATRTYYVRTDGNDSNTGLADNAGGAFLTAQKAIDVASALDNGGYAITIQVRSGTFTGANTLKSYLGSGLITIVGDETTPANVVISVTSNNCFTADGVTGKWALRGMKLSTTTSGHCIYTANGSLVEFENLNFGACAEYHMAGYTGYVTILGNYTISGSAARHFWATVHGAIVHESGTVTLTGTPNMSTAFTVATDMGLIRVISSGVTYSGSGTGKKYTGTRLSDIYTASGGINFFPGDVAGTVDGTCSYA